MISATTLPTTKTIKKISNILSDKTKSNKRISENIMRYRKRRIENDRRAIAQNELLTFSSLKTLGSSSVRSAARTVSTAQVGGSFLSRIVQFAGFVTTGWLLNNMPTWIAGARELSNRIQSLNSTFTGFVDNIWEMISDIGRISTALFENMKTFDLTDSSYRVRTSMTGLIDTLDNMGDQIKEAFSVLTEPFMNVPPLGTEAGPGAYPDVKPEQPSQPSPSGGNADFWTLVAIASREDGDPQGQADVAQSIYNRAKSGAYGSSNIRELITAENQYEPTWQRPKQGQRGKPNPEWFQINDAKSAAKASGFSEGAIKSVAANITNPSLQKNAAEFVQGRTDFKGANSRFPGGIQRKPGDNYFGWQYNYKGTTIASVPNLGVSPGTSSSPSTAKPSPSPEISQKSDTTPTRTIKPIITSRYGEQREKRRHGGTDLATNYGTSVTAVADGKIIETGWENGWGYFLVYRENKSGLYHLYGHMPKGSYKTSGDVKRGEIIGKVGASGRTTGPHLHWEVGKSWNGIIGGKFDPLTIYSSSAPFSTSSQPTPSTPLLPSSPTSQVTSDVGIQPSSTDADLLSEILKSANLATKRQDIVLINDLQPLPTQMPGVVVRSGGTTTTGMSEGDMVNRFIKNKLLLDLNYL